MIKEPEITDEMEEKYAGQFYISWDGEILAFGSDSLKAFQKAKRVMPDLDDKDFLIGRIHPKYVLY